MKTGTPIRNRFQKAIITLVALATLIAAATLTTAASEVAPADSTQAEPASAVAAIASTNYGTPAETWNISATSSSSVIANLYSDSENDGYYTLVTFKSEASFILELQRIAGITDGVLRAMTVRLEEEEAPAVAEQPAEEAPAAE